MKKFFVFLGILITGGIISFSVFWYTLTVNVKGETVKTPNIVGKTPNEAVKILSEKKLRLKINTKRRVFSDFIEKGAIAIQIPEPGKIIKKGREIEVILSKGSRRDIVPDVLGKTVEEASKVISEHGLKLSYISYVNSDKPEGTVISQSPQGGVPGIFNDKVKLLVSRGKKPVSYKMPDLRYMPLLEAEKILRKARISYIIKTFANQIRDKHVLFVKEQYPLPGYVLKSDHTVTLKVVLRENL